MNFFARTLIILSLLVNAWSFSQTESLPAPGVQVVKNSWRKVVRNPALEDDPFKANDETVALDREKRDTAKLNDSLRRQGRELVPPPMQRGSDLKRDEPTSVIYVYEAKIRNTGTKVVQVVVWHYVFFGNENEEEIGRTTCTSKVKLRPGKTVDLIGNSTNPPIKVVQVAKAGQELKGSYIERVVINRLEYDDGTFWQRPED